MRSSVRSNYLDYLVGGNSDPSAVLLDLIVIVAGADFGRAAVREIATGGLRVGSHELRVELGVPSVVIVAVMAFLRRGWDGK
jgi:hypothetical protein